MTIRQRFISAIKRGTGEAHLILLNHPETNLSDEIIRAAVTNFAYDPQCEGSRGIYINELIQLSGRKNKIIEAILRKLATETRDYWGVTQMFDLARIFAQEGNKQAREILYRRFELNAESDIEYCGQYSVIELDGLEGLKKVAEVRGKMLLKDPEDWEDNAVIDQFIEINPAVKVYDELKEAAKHNPFIEVYLNTVRKNKAFRSKRSRRQKYSYNLLKEKIEAGKIGYVSDFILKDLSENEVKQLASDFLNEKDLKEQNQYLRIFTKLKFPYDYHPLLNIAQGELNDNRLVEFAVDALQHFTASEIREFALEKLAKGIEPAIYANLLIASYQAGDSTLLQRIAHQTRSKNSIHFLTRSYIAIYRANRTKECQGPLGTIYQKLNCGLCRSDIVKLLLHNKVLSDKIKSEIPYDSDQETRKLI